MPGIDPVSDVQQDDDQDRRRQGRNALVAGGLAALGVAVVMLAQSCSSPAVVPDTAVSASSVPSVSYAPPDPSTPSVSTTPAPVSSPSRPPSTHTTTTASHPGLPQIGAAAAERLQVPALDIDTGVKPVDSEPTGQTNDFGGPIYKRIDFPVDDYVRQWVQRGDPNSIAPDEAAGDAKEFDRVVIYGHASDIGNHLVFQDLAELKPGDKMIVTTQLGVFTYQVTLVASNEKDTLENMPQLYDYPKDGRKELALVGCLPDTTSNSVVIGVLVGAKAR